MKRIRASVVTLSLFAAAIVPIATATSASAHGWVTDPPSRQDNCSTGATSFDCGAIKYEPQSVEAPKGSFLCSGGNDRFGILDDDSLPWPRTVVGNDIDVTWTFGARHATTNYEYFLDGSHQAFKTVDGYGQQPNDTETHHLSGLPNGEHTILARWTIDDTANAFYSCIDVDVNGTGGSTDPGDGDDGSTDPGDGDDGSTDPGDNDGDDNGGSDTCTAEEWDADAIYNGGDRVTYDGHIWEANWWTTGDTPKSTTQWGVWVDQGACDDSTDPGDGDDGSTDPGDGDDGSTDPGDGDDGSTDPGDGDDGSTDPGDGDDGSTDPGDNDGDDNGGSDTCTAEEWDADAIYNGGDLVSHDGHVYEAGWWTQGAEPGTTGEWGVWTDQGPCDDSTDPGDGDDGSIDPGDGDDGSTDPDDGDDPEIPDPGDNTGEPGELVMGYFTDWGIYQRNYQVKNIVTSGSADKLTHILYAFGNVTNGKCAIGDSYADYDKAFTAGESVDGEADTWDNPDALRGNFNQLRKLKEMYPNIQVIWSFGGWTWSGGFGQAAQNAQSFAESCYNLVHDPRWDGVFDGIDIDWEYPNDCGLTCDDSGPDALPTLLSALRDKFGDELVTAAISADATSGGKLDNADYAKATQYLDFLNPMTYDYFGAWDKKGPTAPHSPLTSYSGMPINGFDTTTTLNKLINEYNIPSDKVLMGLGFYGRGWTGVSDSEPGGTATGAAPGTYEAGIEDYHVLKNTCPPTGTIAGTAYAKCGDQWWSYDTPETIEGKMQTAKDWGLAGAFIWELSGDTDDGELISAVASGLK